MEIKISTKQILNILHVLSWIIFIGVCVEAGEIICNAFLTMTINPANASMFWEQVNLSSLYEFDHGYFLVETSLMSIVAVMKAIMFYLIVKILHDKKLNVVQPFNEDIRRFILKIFYLTLGIGIISNMGANYAKWFVKQGVKMPDIQDLGIGGADVWLFMGVILFVIAQIFKRGIEIQSENELTI